MGGAFSTPPPSRARVNATLLVIMVELNVREKARLLHCAAPTVPQVLMIHGYRQNATSCREKSGAFRKLTRRHVEPVFVSAPLVVPPRADGSTPGRYSDLGPLQVQFKCDVEYCAPIRSRGEEGSVSAAGKSLDTTRKAWLGRTTEETVLRSRRAIIVSSFTSRTLLRIKQFISDAITWQPWLP